MYPCMDGWMHVCTNAKIHHERQKHTPNSDTPPPTDAHSHPNPAQVLIFTPNGAFAQALSPSTSPARLIGSPERDRSPASKPPPVTPDGRFIAPEGVAVGRGGTVVVVDGGAHNFHVYETSM